MNKLCDKIHVFADCQRGVMTIVGKCLDNMDEAAKAIDPNAVSSQHSRAECWVHDYWASLISAHKLTVELRNLL